MERTVANILLKYHKIKDIFISKQNKSLNKAAEKVYYKKLSQNFSMESLFLLKRQKSRSDLQQMRRGYSKQNRFLHKATS